MQIINCVGVGDPNPYIVKGTNVHTYEYIQRVLRDAFIYHIVIVIQLINKLWDFLSSSRIGILLAVLSTLLSTLPDT